MVPEGGWIIARLTLRMGTADEIGQGKPLSRSALGEPSI